MKAPLLMDRLKDYAALKVLPMHMPGHKGNLERYPWLQELGGGLDITEIQGFDDLVEVDWHPGVRSFLSVNGSTGAILAALGTLLKPRDLLMMPRNCHKAVYHGAEIWGARVRYLLPDWDEEFGVFSRLRPETVEAALKSAEEVQDLPAALVVTSPTYEGDISPIEDIAKICHSRGIPLMVDEAHGAHLSLPGFPKSALHCGADIVIQSLHKTLPSPTGTSVVHCLGERVEAEELRRRLLMLQTSSPSFPLMAAAEKCMAYAKEQGAAEAAAWLARNAKLTETIAGLPGLKLRQTDDPSKIVVASGFPGHQWMARLRDKYRIEAEMAEHHALLFMTGMGDTEAGLDRLAAALREEAALIPPYQPERHQVPTLPEKVLEPWEAVRRPKQELPLDQAEGRISAQYFWKYPPGIPFLVPGERVDATAVKRAAALGVTTLHTL